MKFDFSKAKMPHSTESLIYEHAMGDIKLQEFIDKYKKKKEIYKIDLIKEYLEDLRKSELACLKIGEAEIVDNFLKEAD